jgi:cell division protein FtsL
MNNAKYYNDSLAYDFELFMPKSQQSSRAEIVKMPKRKVNKASRRAAKKQVSKAASIIMLGAFLVATICAGIAIRVEISEVNSQIIKAKSQLAALSGEETRIDMEFERLMSYKNIEDAAKALGMRKMDKSQIVYIRVNDTNKAIDANGTVLTAEKE